MLHIWTNATTQSIRETIGPIIKASGVQHKFHPGEELPALAQGDVVLCLGDKRLKLLAAQGYIPKNRTIGSMRETPIKIGDAVAFVSYDPRILERDYSILQLLQWDMRLSIRMHETGTTEPPKIPYTLVTDYTSVIAQIRQLHDKTNQPVPVSLDLETLGLNAYLENAYIVSISITLRPGHAEMIHFTGINDPNYPMPPDGREPRLPGEDLWEQINWICTTPMVSMRGANLKYDMTWMEMRWDIEVTNFKFDSNLVGSLLDENRSNSLENHAKTYTDIGGYDTYLNTQYDKSRMDLVPVGDLLPYAGGDTDAAYRVADILKDELLQDPDLLRFYVRLVHPASIAFRDLEMEGILVDVPYMYELQAKLEAKIAEMEAEALALIPKQIYAKFADDFKLSRPVILKEYMFGPMGLNLKPKMYTDSVMQKMKSCGYAPTWKDASTALEHLMMFADDPKAKRFIDILKERGSASKTLSTYVIGFLTHLRPDNRWHATYMLFKGAYQGQSSSSESAGTDTGRTSAKDPAVQTIPKHTVWAKPLRRAIICPEGFGILEPDFSAGELRIAADLANEYNMIQAFEEGKDLHALTAGGIAGYTYEEMMEMKHHSDPNIVAQFKRMRQSGKPVNFGMIYRISPGGLQAYAAASYGVHMTDKEAEAAHSGFFTLYPAFKTWHEEQIKHAKRHGYVRSPLGRVRHLPLINSPDNMTRSGAERNAINSPVQGTLSDMTQLTMVLFKQQYGRPDGCRMMMMVHDALAFYVRISHMPIWNERIIHIMENLPLHEFGWKPKLKFIAESEWSTTNMADLIELPHP